MLWRRYRNSSPHGADIDAKRGDDGTPLDLATWNHATETSLALIEHGADVPGERLARDYTPLHRAAWNNDSEVALWFSSSAAPTSTRRTGPARRPSIGRRNTNSREVALALIERGADIHAKNNEGKTPWDVAMQENAQGVLAVLREQSAEE